MTNKKMCVFILSLFIVQLVKCDIVRDYDGSLISDDNIGGNTREAVYACMQRNICPDTTTNTASSGDAQGFGFVIAIARVAKFVKKLVMAGMAVDLAYEEVKSNYEKYNKLTSP